ncbi:General secretion pathway protein GspM [Burkholderiales bacterium 8X]|nr:General secretion pathway protein GspM [Burkholderiales bacterium 8X]
MSWIDSLEARWQAWWPELEPREQRLIGLGAALILLALVWWLALAPALRTLSLARTEHARLDAQLQQMASLQARAKELQSQPRASRDDALRALEGSVRQNLGPNAQLQPASGNEAVNIALRAAPAGALAEWFSQARGNARAVPREVHLTRNTTQQPTSNPGAQPTPAPGVSGSAAGTAPDPGAVRWDGTLVMNLPAR